MGGVDTGRIIPSEAENATTTSKPCKPPTASKLLIEVPMAAAIGINKLAVAVLDIKFAMSQQTKESDTMMAKGDKAS